MLLISAAICAADERCGLRCRYSIAVQGAPWHGMSARHFVLQVHCGAATWPPGEEHAAGQSSCATACAEARGAGGHCERGPHDSGHGTQMHMSPINELHCHIECTIRVLVVSCAAVNGLLNRLPSKELNVPKTSEHVLAVLTKPGLLNISFFEIYIP